jgi:hypothetical protein
MATPHQEVNCDKFSLLGKDDKAHWSDTPGQDVRLRKFQGQLRDIGI